MIKAVGIIMEVTSMIRTVGIVTNETDNAMILPPPSPVVREERLNAKSK